MIKDWNERAGHKRQARRWGRLLLALGALMSLASLTGCMNTRGVMYLHPERSGVYLAKENKPKGKAKDPSVEKSVEKARELLRDLPDGKRRLGGFCTDPDIVRKLRQMMSQTSTCRAKLKLTQNTSNNYAWIYWGIMMGTAGAGLATIIGDAASPDGDTRAAVVLAFGITTLTLALTNAIGPFYRIHTAQHAIGTRLDNYMWTLRKRISVEVCTAPNKAYAFYRLNRISKRLKRECSDKEGSNGTYTLPSR